MKKGFTLTELLIVMTLIAFLVIMSVLMVSTQIFKANDARRKAESRRIGIAAEEYEKDHGCYPRMEDIVCEPGTFLQPYLNKIPCDPITKKDYLYVVDPDATCPHWYRVYVQLENEKDPDYIQNLGPSGVYSYESSSPNAPAPEINSPPVPGSGFYGCYSGTCMEIPRDPVTGEPECSPRFGSMNSCNTGCFLDPDTGTYPNQCI